MARRSDELLTFEEIDAFAARLKATVRAAKAADEFRALAAKLGLAAAPARAPAARPAPASKGKAPKAKKAGKRTRRPALDTDVVLQVVASSKEGIAVSEVASKVGQDKQRVAAALRKLRDDKKIKVKGEKRLARWFPA